MAPETARAALAFFAERCGNSRHPTVSFYGGEPLLRLPLIRELVTTAAERTDWPRLRFVIDTNGVMIDDAVIALVRDHGLYLQVSLDGPAEVHDRNRQRLDGRASHAAVIRGVTDALRRERGLADRLTFVATLAPPAELAEVAGWFDAFPPFRRLGLPGPPRVQLNLADLRGIDFGPAVTPYLLSAWRRRQVEYARRRYLEMAAAGRREAIGPVLRGFCEPDLIRFHHRPRNTVGQPVRPGGRCRPGVRKLHVRPDGAFQPCERVGDRLVIGRVDSGFDRTAIRRLQREFLAAVQDRCRSCWAVRLCGLCFSALAYTWAPDGSRPASIPESACEGARRRARETIDFHLALRTANPGTLEFLANSSVY
jgi:uncharacterized protein